MPPPRCMLHTLYLQYGTGTLRPTHYADYAVRLRYDPRLTLLDVSTAPFTQVNNITVSPSNVMLRPAFAFVETKSKDEPSYQDQPTIIISIHLLLY